MLRNDERRSVAPFARHVPHNFWLVETLADTILRRSHWTARFVVILVDRKSQYGTEDKRRPLSFTDSLAPRNQARHLRASSHADTFSNLSSISAQPTGGSSQESC